MSHQSASQLDSNVKLTTSLSSAAFTVYIKFDGIQPTYVAEKVTSRNVQQTVDKRGVAAVNVTYYRPQANIQCNKSAVRDVQTCD
jgi:hypothetical protein